MLFCLAIGAATLSAQGLKQGDRDRMLSYLHSSQKQLLDATDGLSSAQWKFKAAPDKWSIAEVVEHLILAEKGLFGMTQKTANAPAGTAPADKVPDESVLKNIASRAHKAKSPEMFVPTGRFGQGGAEVAKFKEARGETLDWVRKTDIDLRSHFMPSPVGTLDCVQWIFYTSAHTERHVAQILEVKTDPQFPKK